MLRPHPIRVQIICYPSAHGESFSKQYGTSKSLHVFQFLPIGTRKVIRILMSSSPNRFSRLTVPQSHSYEAHLELTYVAWKQQRAHRSLRTSLSFPVASSRRRHVLISSSSNSTFCLVLPKSCTEIAHQLPLCL